MLVLSLLVATAVVWQLKITGITMTGEALCGYLEHRHTESCLRTVEICGLQETDGHSHGTDCYKVLRCTEEVHDHGDACYETVELPACGKEEAEEHHHSEECLQESYICGYQQEHTHSPLCYSNLEADLESSSDWEKTIPALIQDPAADLAAVARSQLGYMESQQNYKMADDGVTQMGYTRYGEWYGNPYGKWNAMFVSFCLRYAEHPAYETLKNSGVEGIRLAAEDSGVYHGASGTVPGIGDLVFLDKDGNETCETVAIVSVCEEGGVYLVEGDCDGVVAENRYALDDSAIVGYAILTAQPETTEALVEEAPKATKAADNPPEDNEVMPAAGDGITVTFVIKKPEYTDDPSAHTTHLTVESTDGLTADGGLTYTAWEGTDKYKVTGNGTLASFTLPAETAFAGNGYSFPTVKVENMTPEEGRQYTYASAYNWVTETGLICNEKTVFPKSTTLYLCLYESGKTCGLNWVCNCDAGGTHSITSYVSGFGSPVFTWEQSLSEPYIPTVAAVNSGYTGSQFCTAGPDHGMQLKGWYVKDAEGNEIDFSADMPILESYKDKDSSGYSVKIYARLEKTEQNIETVTATFVNGEKMDTVSLNKGDALDGKLPVVTAPEGKVFVGWQIGDTTDYATAETVIETDTIYTAVFVSNVTITFMHDGVQYGEAVTVPEGTPLWGYLPAQEPEYSGDGDTPMIFAGWKIGDTDHLVTVDTLAEADMVLYAVFAEVPNYKVYMHDIAPDGKTDYETQGGNASTDRLLPEGSTLAQYLEENDFFMHHDGARASSCKWYTKQEQEGTVTYVPYDLQSPITSELHLYTFNYSVTLTLQEAVTTGSFLNLFPVASAAEVVVNGNTLTMTLREGEKPTAADFVKGEVDYSVYNWSFKDGSGNELELTLADVLKNGVTGNITATSSEDDRAIVATDTAKVRFQVIVNNELKDLGQQYITVYKLNKGESYSISQETLKEVYRDFGFSVEQWVKNQYSCPQMVDGMNSKYWANNPLRQANGLYYNPSVGDAASGSSVLYLPTNNQEVEGEDWTKYTPYQSFYTVTISDPEGIVYSDQSKIPGVQYVFRDGQISVTVPAAEGVQWTFSGKNATDNIGEPTIENADGTTTYTFKNVKCPIVLTPEYSTLPKANKEINFYVFLDNQEKQVASGTYPAYLDGSRYYVSASLLEQIYKDYGFTADQLNSDSQRYFPHAKEKFDPVWADVAPKENGAWFVPILGKENDDKKCDVFYVPGYEGTGSADKAYLRPNYSFYTVKVTDPKNLVYGADQQLPETQIVFRGTTAQVTVKASGQDEITVPGGKYYWMVNGVERKDGVDNGDGTVTFTIADVQEPLVLTPERNFVNVIVEDDNSLLYTAGEEQPRVQLLRGNTGSITVKGKSGYGWIANGESIPGGVFTEGGSAITYTFVNVTEDIILKPVQLLDSINVTYDINPYGTASGISPTIQGNSAFVDLYTGGDYVIIAPDTERYTLVESNAMRTAMFEGWKIDGTEKVMRAGSVLKAEELSQYGTSVTLKAVWSIHRLNHTVSFYVNLELQVADFNNSTNPTPNENYTDPLFGTEVVIQDCPLCDEGREFVGTEAHGDAGIVIQAKDAAATADVDADIRKLYPSTTAAYMEKDRSFALETFPDDETMMAQIRKIQERYIAEYKASGFATVEEYRANNKKIICSQTPGGELECIPVDDLNTNNYTIRWYVFKYSESNGWHVDGVLVKKRAQLTITKTFYGNDDAVNAVKNGYDYKVNGETKHQDPYFIKVLGVNEQNPKKDDGSFNMDGRPTLYKLSLKPEADVTDDTQTAQIEQGYREHDPQTDTYTWVVNLTADWVAWVEEENYTYDQNGVITLSEYLSYNFAEDSYNRPRTNYIAANGVQLAVKAHGVDQPHNTFETVSLYNTYLPSAAVPISKVDDTGKPLAGVSFTLEGSNQTGPISAQIWRDKATGEYHYLPIASDKEESNWEVVQHITVDESGYALVYGLQDEDLGYSFKLIETTTPEGYSSIGIPIEFTIEEADSGDDTAGSEGVGKNFKIILKNQNELSGMVSTPGNTGIRITNTSQLMSVTAVKEWQDETNKKVTLQLMLNDTPIPGKVVDLDGTADTPAEDVTDGYESEDWTVTWENLPAYVGGARAKYTVREIKIGDAAWSEDFRDGYDNYIVDYDRPSYSPETGVPTSATLRVKNRSVVEVAFKKVNHANEALAGAKFQLYEDQGYTQLIGEAISDDAGEFSFGKLPVGVYYMKEIEAPEGYLENDKDYVIEVTLNGKTITENGKPLPAAIQNHPVTVSLNVQKVHRVNGEEIPLGGAAFRVLMWNEGEKKWKPIERDGSLSFSVDDTTGKLTIRDLLPGSYQLVEIQAPDGYYRMTEEVPFTVQPGVLLCDGDTDLWTFDGETNTITVVNVAGSELPQTGGMGTHYGTVAGLLMMAGSLLYGFQLRRKRERGTA